MKILLLGKNGQVGWELQRALAPLGELIAVDRTQVDLAEPEQLRAFVANCAPDIIVNAAAYTAVDKAETEIELAYKINAESVAVLAEEVKKLNAWLIHYSTDYVYDGTKITDYLETDSVNPLSVYGQSKLAGENAIRQSGCKYLNFRTSWVFATKGNNFIKSMLRLASERTELKIVADQVGAPTSAELIADVTTLCIHQLTSNTEQFANERIGTYHLVANGEATWHTYAQHVINKASELGQRLSTPSENILPINTDDYPLPAARPKNSKLNTNKLEQAFSINLPVWPVYVDRMLEELI
ncbi:MULTISPECIES: dTDP-4-dehydrorhamnose reductase [unclassified Pseudoalteromonas]|uniref:dTDP-4-dehydrorhamnose reductase n=1 Tax=unclassified Pseudoalteromonas TaxID=194690 RepID=UPI0005A600AB|nr:MULTISPECIES: dTDP-4-dehydrorhamnose reductase [unclassified Pseudoalteromonas]